MATTITRAQANKIMQVALFTEANRPRSMVNILTDLQAAPKSVRADRPGTKQSSFLAPVVRITDLDKNPGDEVDMQIMYKLNKMPTMGDQKLAGRAEDLNMGSFGIRIEQGRHLVDAGGRMSQKRTKHNLRDAARTLLGTYFHDLQDQSAIIHLAGSRGDYMDDDVIIPLADHHEFKELMINPVMPPTYDRHFFGGDATSFEGIDSADIITMHTVDNLSLFISEMAHPIQPVRMTGDELMNEDPYYVLYLTPRQWNDFYSSAGAKDWQAMASRVTSRSRGFSSPLFRGECVMHRNILVRQYAGMPVRFYQGSQVQVSKNDNQASVTTVEAKTNIDRAILLGGQALANAFGAKDGGHFNYHEERVDHGNGLEISISWIRGLKKIRFAGKNGRMNDNGVMVVDSATTITRR